jgi:YVTN family beta-propeller protein
VLTEHRLIVRAAFERHGGHEIDTQGDSFFVAFPSAKDAVLAALDAQRTLTAHPWPEDAPVRVRMGIHTGQAAVEGERYLGLAVHRAARISAAGHGGQIIVSQTAFNLLEDEEEDLPDVELKDLGVHALKDLARPVRLYQLVGPGLQREFPALRTADAARRRRPLIGIGVGVALIAAAAIAAFLVRGSGSAATTVRPNSVGVIDPRSDRVVGQVSSGVRPDAVAAGDGSIWVANDADRTVSRIDPASLMLRRTISLGGTPTGLAVGAGGVWIAQGLHGDVSRIDPSFDTVETFHVTQVFPGGGLTGIVATGSGVVWAAWGSSTVSRIDSSSGRVLGTTLAGRSPSAIAYGDGSFWVANGGDNTVTKLSAQTNRPVGLPLHVGRDPSGVVVGEGDVWVTARVDGTVTRFDPRSGAATEIGVGSRPSGIAYGDGAVWVANEGDGTVSRIDPQTNRVRTIKVGGVPVGIAVGAGRIWVTVESR